MTFIFLSDNCWTMDIYYWNVEECRAITPDDEILARIFDPSNEIRKTIDETVCVAGDIDDLPEPIQPYAYKQMWERLREGIEPLPYRSANDTAVAIQLSNAIMDLPEAASDAWVLTPGGWLYIQPPSRSDILSPIYNVWQAGRTQEVRGAAAFTLAQSLLTYHTMPEGLPPLTQNELYAWVWNNTHSSASPQYNTLRLNAGIELLRNKVEKGDDASALISGMEGDFAGDIPGLISSQWNLLGAVNKLNIYYRKKNDISASNSLGEILHSLENAWRSHGAEMAYQLYYKLLLVNSSIDTGKIAELMNVETDEIKDLLKGPSSKEAEKVSGLLTEMNMLAEIGVLSAFYFSPLNENVWKGLLKAIERADLFLENKEPAKIAKGWLKFLTTNDRSELPQTLGLLTEMGTGSPFHGVNALNNELWNKILPDVISLLVEHKAWDSIIVFRNMYEHLSPSSKFQIAGAYRMTAFYRTVTKETLVEVYSLYLDACQYFAMLDPLEVPEYNRPSYYLMAGSAWSQLGEFMVDHGGELITAGKVKDNAEVEKNIYRYNALADELLGKALEGDAENPEIHVKIAWNKYYLAKFTENFEESIKAGEASLLAIEELYKKGKADKQQLSSVSRCLMWSYHEKANKLLNAGSYDSARSLLNKATPLADNIFLAELDRKESIDAKWLKFRTSYLMAKASPHPGRLLEMGKDGVEPLSDEAAKYLDKAEAVLAELKALGETEGELSRMKGWVYYRRGDFDTAEALFRTALKVGSVKYRDDTLRGIMLCCQLSFLSQSNIPLTEKQRLLENWAESIHARYATQKDASVLTNLEQVCKKAESIGYKLSACHSEPAK